MNSDIFNDIISHTLFGTSIFKDETKLFREYIPDKLPRREKELERISRDFRIILNDKENLPVNIVLTGRSGVGKTVLAKYFCEKLINFSNLKERKVKVEYQYCNCYTYRTKSGILYYLLSKLYNISSRGFESETLLGELYNHLKLDNKKLILILDEVHVLKEEVLFFLQLGEMFQEARIYLILISRDNEYKKTLDTNLTGKINDYIFLNEYSKEDLIEILNFRSEQAFIRPLPSEIIEMVADMASITKNARHAIEIIYHAGKIADCNNETIITPEMVRQAKNYIFPEITPKLIKTLKKEELLTVLAITRNLMVNNSTDVTVNGAYSYFKLVCEEYNINVNSEYIFRKFIKKLINFGLIIPVNKKQDDSKKKLSRITLYDIPAQILEQQITKLLKKYN